MMFVDFKKRFKKVSLRKQWERKKILEQFLFLDKYDLPVSNFVKESEENNRKKLYGEFKKDSRIFVKGLC